LRRVVSVLGLVAAGMVLAPVTPACACSCAQVTSEEAADNATIVFVGVVRDVDVPLRIFGGSSADPVTVEFDVSEVHKGQVPARMSLTTALDGASCGYPFQEGGRYLVFASDYGSGMTTSLCAGNRDLATETDPFPTGTLPLPVPPAKTGPVPILAVVGAGAVLAIAVVLVRHAAIRRAQARSGGAAGVDPAG
jgi:hypothetical protein